MSQCNHVVAVIGGELVRESEFELKAKEWMKAVRHYNENTLRVQIPAPPQLLTSQYCSDCGEKLDKAAREKVIQGLYSSVGDGSERYDEIIASKHKC